MMPEEPGNTAFYATMREATGRNKTKPKEIIDKVGWLALGMTDSAQCVCTHTTHSIATSTAHMLACRSRLRCQGNLRGRAGLASAW